APVDDHRAVAGMPRDVREVIRVQPQVERVQHETPARDPEVGLVVDEVVPAERRNAVAALEAEPAEGNAERPRAAARLAVRALLEALVRLPRYELRIGPVGLGAPEQGRQGELIVHHQAVHWRSPRDIALRRSRSRSGSTSWPSRST